MAIDLSKPTMITSDKTAREIFEEVRANPARARFGFGDKLAIINVDLQDQTLARDAIASGHVAGSHDQTLVLIALETKLNGFAEGGFQVGIRLLRNNLYIYIYIK